MIVFKLHDFNRHIPTIQSKNTSGGLTALYICIGSKGGTLTEQALDMEDPQLMFFKFPKPFLMTGPKMKLKLVCHIE